MVVRSKAQGCNHSIPGIAGSNFPYRHGCSSLVLIVCCAHGASATDWSLVQRRPNGCLCLPVYDLKTSNMRRDLPDFGCCSTEKGNGWQYTAAYTFFLRRCTTAQIRPRPPRFEVSRSHKIIHIHPKGLLWTNDKLVAEAATYTTHNKHKRQRSKPSAGFEPATPAIKRPQTYARHIHTYTIHTVYIQPRWEIRVKFRFENLKGWDLGGPVVGRILKLVLNKSGVRVRNGCKCFRTGYSGGMLAAR
jgi:hypothetical protein